nr:hypothetical protein [Tanacetum cinerariifolium]
DDEELSLNLNADEEEENQEDEYGHTPENDESDDDEKMDKEEEDDVIKELYEDLNINLGNKDADMTNDKQDGEDQHNASHELGFVQEKEDAHVTLTTVHDKTKRPMKIIVDCYVDNKLEEAIQKAIWYNITKCRDKAQAKKHEYIDLIDTSVRAIISQEKSGK